MSGVTGKARRKTTATKMTLTQESGRRHDPTTQVSSKRVGEEYTEDGTDREDSADESAKWGGVETEESETEEEAATAGGGGGVSMTRTVTARGS